MRSSTPSRAVSMSTGCQRPRGAQALADLEAVGAGQHHVEDDGVVVAGGRLEDRLLPVAREVNGVARAAQPARERGRHLRLVLDDQESHRYGPQLSDPTMREF